MTNSGLFAGGIVITILVLAVIHGIIYGVTARFVLQDRGKIAAITFKN